MWARRHVSHSLIVCALSASSLLNAQQATTLDTTNFVVLGEGLAAGLGDFSLRDIYQEQSFPALMAKQMKTAFPMPLVEPPGIGSVPGFPELETTVPARGQSTVRHGFPPGLFIFNLSVPGMRLADSATKRAKRPLIQPDDQQQTVVNLILGYPALTLNNTVPLWSQLEYATAMAPTLGLVELGYYEILDAAVKGDVTRLPDVATFQTDYARVVSTLRATFADVVVTTVPNPFDTAYFTTPANATRLVGASPQVLNTLYSINATDLITAPGIMAIGNGLYKNSTSALPAGSVVSSAVATQVTARVAALNAAINTVAQQNGATVYDLNAFFARVKAQGLTVGTRTLTADYLGGAYTLSGSYPGTTMHAFIANDILALINKTYSTNFAAVSVAPILATDPAARHTPSR